MNNLEALWWILSYLLPQTATEMAGMKFLTKPTNGKVLDINLFEVKMVIFYYTIHSVTCGTGSILWAVFNTGQKSLL